MNHFHLVPLGDRWKLTTEQSSSDIAEFDTRDEALENAAAFLDRNHGSLKIHRADGMVEEERIYPQADDPRRTPR